RSGPRSTSRSPSSRSKRSSPPTRRRRPRCSGASACPAERSLLVQLALALVELALVEFTLTELELAPAELGFALVELRLPHVQFAGRGARGRRVGRRRPLGVLLALPTIQLLVELGGPAVGDRRRRAVARGVLEADRTARRRVVGGARAPARA